MVQNFFFIINQIPKDVPALQKKRKKNRKDQANQTKQFTFTIQ